MTDNKLFYLNFFLCQWLCFRIKVRLLKVKYAGKDNKFGNHFEHHGYVAVFPVMPLTKWNQGSYYIKDEREPRT